MSDTKRSVDLKLLLLLAGTLSVAAFAAQSLFIGGDGPAESGFDGPISVPLTSTSDDTPPLIWEAPLLPRNPFELERGLDLVE